MPGMGEVNSAQVATHCLKGFTKIRFGLVVGTCGGVSVAQDDTEIFLGDVIISTGIVQTDFGRQSADRFRLKNTLNDNPGQQCAEIRSFLEDIRGIQPKKRMRVEICSGVAKVLEDKGYKAYSHPSIGKDYLYAKNCRHKHRKLEEACAICDACTGERDSVCDAALDLSCEDLGCDKGAHRRQRESDKPTLHFGLIASSSAVIKSSFHKEQASREEGVYGFDMEAAGVWDVLPTIVIQGVCNYADSHIDDVWQKYAAMTGAATARALLLEWGCHRRSTLPFPLPQDLSLYRTIDGAAEFGNHTPSKHLTLPYYALIFTSS